MTEQLPEPAVIRKPPKVASTPAAPPKSLNAHRPMNFAHAMKLFKNMQKRKAQISAREKHKVKKVKEKPPAVKAQQQVQVGRKRSDESTHPAKSSKAISKSARKKKHKSKKSKSVNSSKLASVPKVDEDEIEIDIVDV